MRVLVTGGAGFVGSRLVPALVARGDEVTVLDDLSSSGSWRPLHGVRGDVTLVRADIRDEAALARLPGGAWDRVYHLAASFANERSLEEPAHDRSVNVDGTAAVLAHARARGTGLFVYAGSSSSYGDVATPFREDGPQRPGTPYARTKLEAEALARGAGLPAAVLRLFNVYGPGDPPGRFRNAIPNMVSAVDRTGRVPILGQGATRDFTYVEDVVGILCAAERAAGDVVNVGTGLETRVLDVAEKILWLLDLPRESVELRPARPWDRVTRRVADVARLAGRFGATPATRLEDGLRATLAWLHAEGHSRRAPR